MKSKTFECTGCGLNSRTKTCGVCTMLALRAQDYFDMAGLVDEFRDRCMCVYCGEPATDKEHVIPRFWGGDRYTVPSCRECNQMAGPKLFGSLNERRAFIEGQVKRKYKRLVNSPEWDRDEIKSLDYTLRVAVQASEDARKVVISRLEFMRTARTGK
jgi:hypothetical protein